MESSKETPGGPILCINNCGFFGSAATMNMCSKCHREIISKQEQAKLAASSFENIVNGNSSSSNDKEPLVTIDVQNKVVDVDVNVNVSNEKCLDFSLGQNSEVEAKEGLDFSLGQNSEVKAKEGPNRCITCHKRVGLTGFNCKCGNLFCGMHRYSDKHDCTFDYRASGQAAIAKENPVVKAKKLDKI